MQLDQTPLFTDGALKHYFKLESTASTIGGLTLTNDNSVAFNPFIFNNGADTGASNTNKGLRSALHLSDTDLRGSWSVVFWLYLYALPGAGQTYRPWIDNAFLNGASISADIYVDSGGNLNFSGYPIFGFLTFSCQKTIQAGVPYHIALTCTPGAQQLIVNGELASTDSQTYISDTNNYGQSNQTGLLEDPDNSVYVTSGLMDDYAVFTKVLSLAEVRYLSDNGAPMIPFL